MKRATRAVAAVAALVTMTGAAQAYASPTSPDPDFDGDGVLTIHSASHDEVFADMAVLPDGKTMLLLVTQDEPAIELYRLRMSGAPDPTFGGGDGVFAFALASNYEQVALAVDPHSGKSYVSTFLDNGTTSPTTVWRIKADGTLDSAYGGVGTGHVLFNQRLVQGLVAQPDGKLLMAGSDFADGEAKVWRLTNAGAPDSHFGTAGATVLSTTISDEVSGIALQSDDKVVVAGDHYSPTASTLLAFRLTKGGAFDPTFSGNGKAVVNPSTTGVTTSTLWSPDVLIRPDGRMVFVAGLNQSDGSFRNTLFLAGLRKGGSPDPAFGKHVYTGISETWGQAALERDGKVIVAGYLPPSPSTT
ncbi:MAG: hypothetical protein ABI586_11445, partial [Candidatus Nanopelagicales bacterium]